MFISHEGVQAWWPCRLCAATSSNGSSPSTSLSRSRTSREIFQMGSWWPRFFHAIFRKMYKCTRLIMERNWQRRKTIGTNSRKYFGYKPVDLEGDELWHGIPDSNALFTTNNLPSLNKEECKLLNNDESLDTLLNDEAMEKEIFPAMESTKITAREQEDDQSTLVEMDMDKEELGSSLNEIVWVSNEGQTDKQSPLMVTEKTRKVSANAVERARQKDRKSRRTHDSVNARLLTEVSEISCNLKSRDVNLAFRSPNRQREFKSYTLKDYRKQQPGIYIELGRLGPDTTTESLLNQRDKLEKMKAFGRNARDINILQTTESRKPKDKLPSCRDKAIEFASKIPKPRKKILQKENLKAPLESPIRPLTELEKMEAKHQKDRQHIEAIRHDLECFLR